jgi:hypothetical protein
MTLSIELPPFVVALAAGANYVAGGRCGFEKPSFE